MPQSDQQFIADLSREDEVGLVLRGHLHIEYELKNLISDVLPFPEYCQWETISYRAKVELALSCGLPIAMRELLQRLGKIRNDFAHDLMAAVDKKWALDTYNALPENFRDGLKTSYLAAGRGPFTKPAQQDARDLLTLILLNARQVIRAAMLNRRQDARRVCGPPLLEQSEN